MAGLREILIITTPEEVEQFKRLLGNGRQWSIELSFAIQDRLGGIAEAFLIGRDFLEHRIVRGVSRRRACPDIRRLEQPDVVGKQTVLLHRSGPSEGRRVAGESQPVRRLESPCRRLFTSRVCRPHALRCIAAKGSPRSVRGFPEPGSGGTDAPRRPQPNPHLALPAWPASGW